MARRVKVQLAALANHASAIVQAPRPDVRVKPPVVLGKTLRKLRPALTSILSSYPSQSLGLIRLGELRPLALDSVPGSSVCHALVLALDGLDVALSVTDSVALVPVKGRSTTATFVGTPDAVARLVSGRLAPGHTPAGVTVSGNVALDDLRRGHGDDGGDPIDVRTELALSIPGTRTDPGHWIVTTAIAAWEAVTGTPHEPILATSGATDANILRSRGVPTVRVGLPKVTGAGGEVDFAAGMNTVDVGALELLTHHLVTTAMLAGSTTRAELGGTADG